jgi:hypothetical protein
MFRPKFTPGILRALCIGIRTLQKGSPADQALAREVLETVFQETGRVLTEQGAIPAEQVTEGWVNGVKAYRGIHYGVWWDLNGNPVPKGTTVYLTQACRTPLRRVG